MTVHRVTCINRLTTFNGTHDHITHLGLGNETGWLTRITVDQAVEQLRSPYGDRYFTVSPSTGFSVNVVEGGCEICGQRPYVRTTADGIYDNNLMALPICQG